MNNHHNSEFIFDDYNSQATIQDTYLQQVRLYKYFDYELKGLLLLLHNNPHFLVDYIKSAVEDNKVPDSNLSQIWVIEGIEPAVEDVLNFLRSDSIYRVNLEDKWENALFMNVKNGTEKAKTFLKKQFNQSLGDRKHTEQIVLISRGIFNDLYDIFIKDYIEYIETPDDFFQIDWLNLRSGISVYGENTTFGDIEAAKWSSLLSSFEGVTSPKVYAIKARSDDTL